MDQCKAILRVAKENDPKLLPYIAVCLFAGLRPEREAKNLSWRDIRDGAVFVRGLHAKNRQQREVPINETLGAWLAPTLDGEAMGPAMPGDLPVVNLRKRFESVRKKAGVFKDWPQDVMRHTFASNSLAVLAQKKPLRRWATETTRCFSGTIGRL